MLRQSDNATADIKEMRWREYRANNKLVFGRLFLDKLAVARVKRSGSLVIADVIDKDDYPMSKVFDESEMQDAMYWCETMARMLYA